MFLFPAGVEVYNSGNSYRFPRRGCHGHTVSHGLKLKNVRHQKLKRQRQIAAHVDESRVRIENSAGGESTFKCLKMLITDESDDTKCNIHSFYYSRLCFQFCLLSKNAGGQHTVNQRSVSLMQAQ